MFFNPFMRATFSYFRGEKMLLLYAEDKASPGGIPEKKYTRIFVN